MAVMELFLNDVGGESLGVILVTPPPILSAGERGEWVSILALDGAVWHGDGAPEARKIKYQIYVRETASVDAVMDWIHAAKTLRVTPRAWEYRTDGSDAVVELTQWEGFPDDAGWLATVTMTVLPYRYIYPHAAAITLTSAGTVTNAYSDAEPIMTLTATGDVTLMVGAYTMHFDGMTGPVVIDCGRCVAYRASDVEAVTASMMLGGDGARRWPRLVHGSNAISWLGSVTKLVIDPQWRSR